MATEQPLNDVRHEIALACCLGSKLLQRNEHNESKGQNNFSSTFRLDVSEKDRVLLALV